MKNAGTLCLALLFSALLGVAGCTHQKNGAFNAKIRELETRYAKLEEDHRAAVAATDVKSKKLAQSESQRNEMQKQIMNVTQERDELRKQLTDRTSERDSVHSHLQVFHKDLQQLTTRVEQVANTSPNAILTIAIPASRKSE